MSTTSSISSTSEPLVSIANGTEGAAGGSVINVSELVSELVSAAQAPQESVIENQTTAVTSEISAVGSLQSALSTFQSSLSALATPTAFASLSATSSDSTVVSAATDGSGDAVAGNYNVTVSQLASAQQLLSKVFTGGSSEVVGTGTLSLSLGGSSFNVTIDSSDDTLSSIATAINDASDNPGITATVLQGTDGAYLLLSSAQTGAANTIQVTETDDGGQLAALTTGSGDTDNNYTQQSAAQDAQFTIAGVAYDNASNTVSDALPGVTLNLLATTGTADSATVTVANDTSTVDSNIQAFVSAYNTLQSSLSSLGSYDSTSSTAGPLMGNPLLTVIQNQIQNTLYSEVGSSTYNTLASVGITANSDGSLSVNDTTLQAALSGNFSAVSQLFSGTDGVAAQLNAQMTADLADNGPISTASQTLASQENSLTQQSDTLNTQMAALTQSLTEQYSSLNTLLSSLESTSAYLTEAFADLPQIQSTQNA